MWEAAGGRARVCEDKEIAVFGVGFRCGVL
jgi:hypothetical protein